MFTNYFCHLTGDSYHSETKCPGCENTWGVEWDTENGEAMPGDFDVRCPDCGKEFTIDVELRSPKYTVR